VMNLALFLILFVFGFLAARIPGVRFWMQAAMLSISSFVGLNPQVPVPSQTIIDTFLGLIAGMVIATVVGRLIWPVLPQRVFRDDFLAIVAQRFDGSVLAGLRSRAGMPLYLSRRVGSPSLVRPDRLRQTPRAHTAARASSSQQANTWLRA